VTDIEKEKDRGTEMSLDQIYSETREETEVGHDKEVNEK
jgi:hypothetical protein